MVRKDSLAWGAVVLTLAGFLIRLSGMLYKIPLIRWLGAEGIGLYQMALPAFGAFYRVAVGGIPAALSNLVSEYESHGRPQVAEQALQLAMQWTIGLSLVAAALLALTARSLAGILGDSRVAAVLVVLAPAVYLFSVQQVYGGYLQGRQLITPWAMANLTEQAGRIAGALLGAWLLKGYGLVWGAAGAAVGAVTAGLLSDLYLMLVYRRVRWPERLRPGRLRPGGLRPERLRPGHLRPGGLRPGQTEDSSRLAWRLFQLAWPVTLGALALPLLNFVDVALIQHGLQRAGLSRAEATDLYGQLSGVVYTLVTMPNVLALGLAGALLPKVTAAWARGHRDQAARRCYLGLRATALIGLPAAILFMVLAGPATAVFGVPQAAPLLLGAAPIALFSPLMLVGAGALQGLGLTGHPVRHLTGVMVAKVVLDGVVTRLPEVGIRGVVATSTAFYLVVLVLNLRALERALGYPIPWSRVLAAPLPAALGTGAAVAAMVAAGWTLSGPWGTLATGLVVAPPLYLGLLIAARALTWKEIRELVGPVAARLERFLPHWPWL